MCQKAITERRLRRTRRLFIEKIWSALCLQILHSLIYAFDTSLRKGNMKRFWLKSYSIGISLGIVLSSPPDTNLDGLL